MRDCRVKGFWLVASCLLPSVCLAAEPHRFDSVYAGMQCEPCGSTFFCSGGDRFACPDHSATEFSHENHSPSDIEDCVCLPGFLRTDDRCVLGEAGAFYYQQGLPLPCPQHQRTFWNGSSLESQCVCVPGYFRLHDASGSCEPCAADTYNPFPDQQECVACPLRSSHAVLASVAVADCVCDAGSFGQPDAPGECELCPSGSFKGAEGPAACAPCAGNTFSNGTGATGCVACHAQSVAAGGSGEQSDCECVAGFQDSEGVACDACVVGKMKMGVSHAACELCAAGSFQFQTAQSVCFACGDFSTSEPGRGFCECDAGHTSSHPEVIVPAPMCEACAADTYKEELGPAACDVCGLLMRSPEAAVLQTQCLCDEGYFFTGLYDTCVACAAGTFKSTVSNGAADVDCVACPAASFSSLASTNESDCSCNAGYTPGAEHNGCDHCDAGYFKEAPGPALCASCAAGTFSAHLNATRCQDCYAGADSPASSIALEACLCAAGFEPNETAFACEACPAGTFNGEAGGLCAACANGTFTALEASTVCSVCESRSAAYATPRTFCECDAGHDALQGCPDASSCLRCRACPADFFKETHGDAGCEACQANSASVEASVEQSSCRCVFGFHQVGEAECVACEPGFFSDTFDAEICEQCGEGRFANESAMSECHACWRDSASNAEKTGCDCNPGFAPDGELACAACAADTFKETRGSTACQACRDDSQSAMESSLVSHCECNAGFELHGSAEAGECVACSIGTFRPSASNEPCWLCAASLTTEFEQSASVEQCVCAPGEQFSADGACESCPVGTIKDVFGREACGACQLCAVDQEVLWECNFSHPIACAACPAHSSSLGRQRSLAGACACDAGYALDGRGCVACEPGTFKEHTNNSFACAACAPGQFTTAVASTACLECSARCEAPGALSFVAQECNASRDVVCAACTVCGPGAFAQPACGVASSNDRADTACAVCTPGFYCPGGGERVLCPGGSESAAGRNSSADCGCLLGYATSDVGMGCMPCGFDTYCRLGLLFECPAHSLTLGIKNSVIHDCVCLRGFYKVLESAANDAVLADNFSCAVCTVDDFCFNNSLFNCSDERMRSVSGSDEAADCRCVSGFYNSADHLRCLPCERDHFCVDGTIFACAADQWTQNQTRQEVCTCRPGLRAAEGACVPCDLNSFCVGDNHSEACRAHSSTAGPQAAAYLDCLCDIGFGDGGGAAGACVACAAGRTFKSTVGNAQCANCTRCVAASGLYTSVWCSASSDAQCDACEACADAEVYTHRQCSDLANSECRPCAQCDSATQLELTPCQTDRNRACRDAEHDPASCAAGFYRGGHTEVSDSFCLPCLFNDTLLNGQSLHAATSHGLEYGNPFSCAVACLGNSRLRDASRPWLGCVSCEVGNVLLKVFPADMRLATSCAFSCHPGFERVLTPEGTDGCYIPRLKAGPRRAFAHNVSVGDFSRAHGHTRLRISHSSHGFFALVLGGEAPRGCRHSADAETCCLAPLWRVSTLAQMGLAEIRGGACVGRAGLSASDASVGALRVDISDAMLSDVARCSTSDGVRTCALVVSIVDVITWRVVSAAFALRTTRSVTLGYAPAQGRLSQMLPLDVFDVQVSLWRVLANGGRVMMMRSTARGAAMLVSTRVVGMRALSAAEVQAQLAECGRVSLGHHAPLAGDAGAADVQLEANATLSLLSWWEAGAALPVFKALFTLQQADDEEDVMDVAAVRDTQFLQPLCAPAVHAAEYFVGEVWTAAGLGEAAVARMRPQTAALDAGGRPAFGKLASLLTCVAERRVLGVRPLRLQRILAVHLRGPPPPHAVANATVLLRGVRDFTFDFRTWCFAEPATCHLEYIAVRAGPANLFVLPSCNASHQEQAVRWLQANYGVPHDAGHVAAVCAHQDAMLPFQSASVLINTMRYTSRQLERWNTFQEAAAALIRSHVWVDFRLSDV